MLLIFAEPKDQPSCTRPPRQFRVADLDGNQLRIFFELFLGIAAAASLGQLRVPIQEGNGPSRDYSCPVARGWGGYE